MNDTLFLKALRCENRSRPPIWIMRQAGRYMPKYRAIREKFSFLEMCHQPEIAAKVTLLPIEEFGFDAAILFSDILVIPEALKVGLRFEEGKGPIIERPLKSDSDIDALLTLQIESGLNYVAEAIRIARRDLKVPLIGFCGAPFTVASYMIEGGSSRDLKKTKQWMLRNPSSFHRLLEKIAECTITYLEMQVKAGVNALQIFDSWAITLAHSQFLEFSLRYLKKIIDAMRQFNVPIILFCRGSSVFAEQLASLSPCGIGLDWQVDITRLRSKIPKTVALQGNLDPDILYADSQVIRREAKAILNGMRQDPGFIFNLGHGIHPDTPMDSVKALVDCIKASSAL